MDEGVQSETEEKIPFLGKVDQNSSGKVEKIKEDGNLAESLQIPFEEFTEEVSKVKVDKNFETKN